ncbi:fungal trichothecene efflux pump [Coniochaeta sp. 2T2.1]|nr:fungal trichothecene efflux pump [Coniochaeta sp. 2T2.1]
MATSEKDNAEATISYHDQAQAHPKTELSRELVLGQDFAVDSEELPKGYFRGLPFLGSMFAIGVSYGAGVGGFAFVAPILANINADIGPSPNLTWVALTYTLTTAIGLVVVGRLTDLFGRRWFMIGGNVFGLLGTIVCATATSINAMIAGQTLIGLGASTQLSFCFTVNELVPFKYRLLANGYIYIWGTVCSGLGPVIAYAFVYKTTVGWRAAFYLLIAMNAVGLASWYFFYHPPSFNMKHGPGRKMQFLREFDYVGTLMAILGLLLLLMGLSWGGNLHPWKSAHVIATIVVGFLLLVAFILYETFMPLKEPLIPVHLFRNRGLVINIALWSIGASVYYAFAIVWPTMVVVLYAPAHAHDPMWAGYAALAVNGGISFGELLGSCQWKWIHHQIRAVFFIGSALLAATASCTPDTPGRAITLMFLGSMFIGWNEILNSCVATICVKDQRELGTAIGFGGSSRSFVSTVCATVYTVVLANRLAVTVPQYVPPALVAAGLPSSSVEDYFTAIANGTAAAFAAVPGISPTILAVGQRAYQEANAAAYRTVFLSTIAFSGIGIILTIFLPDVDHLLTNEVTTPLQASGNESQITGEKVMVSEAA